MSYLSDLEIFITDTEENLEEFIANNKGNSHSLTFMDSGCQFRDMELYEFQGEPKLKIEVMDYFDLPTSENFRFPFRRVEVLFTGEDGREGIFIYQDGELVGEELYSGPDWISVFMGKGDRFRKDLDSLFKFTELCFEKINNLGLSLKEIV